jgi:YggT family protein
MNPIQYVICLVISIYFVVLLIRIILSWVPSLPEPVEPAARAVRAVTDPLLIPLRGVLPPLQMGGMALDLSPIVLFFALSILRGLLCR